MSRVGTKAACDEVGTGRSSSPGFRSLNRKYYTFFGTEEKLDEKAAAVQAEQSGIFNSCQWYRHLKPTEETFLSNVVKLRHIKMHSLGQEPGLAGVHHQGN